MERIFFLFAACLISGNLFSQEGLMNQGAMISKNVYHEIPFSGTIDEIIQSVNLKGNAFKFILDTGAPLAISQELQNSIKYPILIRVPLKDANNHSDTINIVNLDTFRLGNIIFINIPAVVLDFKNSPIACKNIDGIVGSNIVRFLIAQFDLKRGKIILTDTSKKMLPVDKNSRQPIFLDNQSNAFLKVNLTNSLLDTVHFDSGMGNLYDMNLKKVLQLVSVVNTETIKVKRGFGVTGQGMLGKAKEDSAYLINTYINLGNQYFENVEIGTTQAKSRIGRDLLNYGTLTIDYINRRYYFNKYPQRLNASRPNFGFNIIAEKNKATVGVVWEATEAQKKGLHSGIEIVSINGKTFFDKTSCEISKILLKEYAEKKLEIIFLSDGMKKYIQLTNI